MAPLSADFPAAAEREFSFLANEHGFRGPTRKQQAWQSVSVSYESDAAQVDVSLENEEELFVYVRLIHDGVPGSRDDPGETFLLDSLIDARSHGQLHQIGGRVRDSRELHTLLSRYRDALNNYCPDLLAGRSADISEFQEKQRSKVREFNVRERRS